MPTNKPTHSQDRTSYSDCPSIQRRRFAPVAAAPDLLAVANARDLDKAHDELSKALEDENAGNDEVRDAAIRMCDALNAHHEERRAAIAKAEGREN